MNVLSLFDGMSCGRIALERLGIDVDNYYASEIDKYAIQVSQANYPDIIQVGNILNWQDWDIDWESINLVTGGFPCQSWSIAGKGLGDRDDRGKLFWVMLDVMKKVMDSNPSAYYLMENVRMKKEFEEYITMHTENALPNVNKYMINSALVSAQNRIRFYWTNIPGIEQPEQRGIVLRDILETNASNEYLAGENLQKNYKSGNQLNPNYKSQANTIHDTEGKSGTICAGTHGYANGYVADVDPKYYLSDKAIDYMNRGSEKYTGKKTRAEHYIKHESEKSKTLTANMHKGVPYGVIAVDKEKKQLTIKEATKKGYTTIEDGDCFDMTFPKSKTRRGRNMKDKSNCLTAANYDYMRYEHSEEEKEVYWRKLTPVECERLQTVPDNYTNHVSNTQRYKMLGNGWTIEVITHILKNMDLSKGK